MTQSLYLRLRAQKAKATETLPETDKHGPAKKSKASPGKKVSFSAPEQEEKEKEEDEDEEEEEEDEGEGEEEDEEVAEDPFARAPETEQAKQIREAILQVCCF